MRRRGKQGVIKLCLLIWLTTVMGLSAHSVNQLVGKLSADEARWEYRIKFDIGLLDEEQDSEEPQKPRAYLLFQSDEEAAQLRRQTKQLIESLLRVSPEAYELTFPDYDSEPPSFPELADGGAYLTVLLSGKLPEKEALVMSISDGDWPSVIVMRGTGNTLSTRTLWSGQEEILLSVEEIEQLRAGKLDQALHRETNWWEKIRLGYEHVIPEGLDHVLFVIALCLLQLKWRPILWQSLLFTAAHMITIGLVAAGHLPKLGTWIEVVIAASIVVMALDSLRKREKVGFSRYVAVFGFGLVHGLGFGNALSVYLKGNSQFVPTLASMNLGVELAQVTVVIVVMLISIVLGRWRHFPKVRVLTALTIAVLGLQMVLERI